MTLEDIVYRLVQLNDDNLVEEVKNSNDVQWCLSELQDLLEVIGDMNGARLRDLAEADKEGRVVVLPCKVGDTVYRVFTIDDREPVIQATQVKTLGQAADLIGRVGKLNKLVSVFRTREEAEKALEEIRNGN